MRMDLGKENNVYPSHIVPFVSTAGEVKTKPTQHSVKEMRSIGIQLDLLMCDLSKKCKPMNETNYRSILIYRLSRLFRLLMSITFIKSRHGWLRRV